MPNGRERIPCWFEHQIRGNTIAFWFRKKIPSVTFIILSGLGTETDFRLFVNDFNLFPATCICDKYAVLASEHAFLLNLELNRHIFENFENKPELKIKLKKNEWNHVELNWGKQDFSDFSVQMGIHLLKEKSNTEEDVTFTNPYRTTTTKPFYSQSLVTNAYRTTTTTKPFYSQSILADLYRTTTTNKPSYSQSILTNPYRSTTTAPKPSYSQSLVTNSPRKLRKFRRILRKQGFVKNSETESLQKQSPEDTKSDGEMRLEVTEL